MAVTAAGALLWRLDKGQLLVAVIHRARYNDWSWPKGKVDPGETLPETAVREIREETGLGVKLGVFLGIQKYDLANGKNKEVHYWAAHVGKKALKTSSFKPSEEVAKVDWLKPDEAKKLLTYPHDLEFLTKLEELHTNELLETKPFIVLRHAKATPRSDWRKSEYARPLLPFGKRQAQVLRPLLATWAPKQVFTSPWQRCRATVEPYARWRETSVKEYESLTEAGNAKKPAATLKVVHKLIQDGRATLLCTHRPALPTILEELAKYHPGEFAEKLSNAKSLAPGWMVTVHLTVPKPGKPRKIVSVEIYGPEITEEK